MHTDAEGRMVLADTLYFASQAKPKLLIDYATLTGACIGALSTRLSGALTNRPALVPTLIRAGEDSGNASGRFRCTTISRRRSKAMSPTSSNARLRTTPTRFSRRYF